MDKLSSMGKAKKAMLACVTVIPLRRKTSLMCPGPPTVSFEGFVRFVAEVPNKKVDPRY